MSAPLYADIPFSLNGAEPLQLLRAAALKAQGVKPSQVAGKLDNTIREKIMFYSEQKVVHVIIYKGTCCVCF